MSAESGVLAEISVSLGDIAAQLESAGFADIGSALADIVGLLEKKAELAPQAVQVSFPESAVHVHVAKSEPVVHIQPARAAKGWLIEFVFNGTSATIPTGAKLTRIE